MAERPDPNHAAFAEILAECQERHRGGEIAAVEEAVHWCGRNGVALPEWCIAPLIEGLQLLNERPAGQGKLTPRKQFEARQRDKFRARLVDHELEFSRWRGGKLTFEQACEAVAKTLSKPSVTPHAVRKSYRLAQKRDTEDADISVGTGDDPM